MDVDYSMSGHQTVAIVSGNLFNIIFWSCKSRGPGEA
jgi:hypothetical protein